jgi:intein-encoded DNA endonuclease-like protein
MKILDKLGLKVFILKDKRYNCNRIKVHSKQLMEFLNLELQVKGNIEMGIGFVSGMIDAEGYVNHEKSFANIVNTDLDVLKKCKDVFEKLGIDVNIKKRNRYKKDKKSSYILNIPYKVKNIKLNSIKLTAG